MNEYPTAWQRRVLWNLFTYVAVAGTVAVALLVIYCLGQAVGFFQPVLIPFGVAAVLAFLLDPVVGWIEKRTRLKRPWAVLSLLGVIVLGIVLAGVTIVPQIYSSAAKTMRQMPQITQKAQQKISGLIDASEAQLNKVSGALPGATPAPSPDGTPPTDAAASPAPAPAAGSASKPSPTPAVGASGNPTPAAGQEEDAAATADDLLAPNGIRNYLTKQIPALQARVPAVLNSVWHFVTRSLGALGSLLDLIIIPVYLYFLLAESKNIARHWNDYVPLRDSAFKKEVVSVLIEINGYLVAFFRGQLLVSAIDAVLVGLGLAFIVHLNFSIFIALLVLVLTFIPYLGIIICYVPAILIAIVQFGDWQHPALVVAVMFAIQTVEATLISPQIVGDSVGLHPMTVILSVFAWSLLLQGPIGALLAVPLSATVKVLLRRYVWEASGRGRHFLALSPEAMGALQDETKRAEAAEKKVEG